MADSLKSRILRLAPDWVVSTVFRFGRWRDPQLARRSSLVMCQAPVGVATSHASLPDGYSLRRISGPSAPAAWIETVRAAGIHVTAETWTTDLAESSTVVTAVLDGESMAGTAALARLTGLESAFGLITWVAVRPEYQGRGLGAALIAACLSDARDMHLDGVLLLTDDHRVAAIKTYLGAGFRPCLNSWDWAHRPRWRQIATLLKVSPQNCTEPSHKAAIARIR